MGSHLYENGVSVSIIPGLMRRPHDGHRVSKTLVTNSNFTDHQKNLMPDMEHFSLLALFKMNFRKKKNSQKQKHNEGTI
jgi:hypothetical protein